MRDIDALYKGGSTLVMGSYEEDDLIIGSDIWPSNYTGSYEYKSSITINGAAELAILHTFGIKPIIDSYSGSSHNIKHSDNPLSEYYDGGIDDEYQDGDHEVPYNRDESFTGSSDPLEDLDEVFFEKTGQGESFDSLDTHIEEEDQDNEEFDNEEFDKDFFGANDDSKDLDDSKELNDSEDLDDKFFGSNEEFDEDFFKTDDDFVIDGASEPFKTYINDKFLDKSGANEEKYTGYEGVISEDDLHEDEFSEDFFN